MTLICWDLSASLGPRNSLNEKYFEKSERDLKEENSTKKLLGPGWSPMGYWGEGRAGDWSSASKPAPRTILSASLYLSTSYFGQLWSFGSFVHLNLPIQFILWAVLEFWGLGPPNFLCPPHILGSFQGGLSDNSTHMSVLFIIHTF